MDDDQRNICSGSNTTTTTTPITDHDHQKLEEVVLPGFRFHPTDEELVGFYLKRKIQQKPLSIELINQLDIYKYDPWDLPKLATTGEKEWYFYCPRDRKYRNSTRPNRVTGAGFWKATGTDRPIYSSDGSKCIGLKKSLVFYKGRAAKGVKTDWMMHEFRLPSHDHHHPKTPNVQDAWAICRIFKKASSSTGQRAPSHSWVSPSIPHHQIPSSQDDDHHILINTIPSMDPHHLDDQQYNIDNIIPSSTAVLPAPLPPMADFSSYKLINHLSLNTAAGDLASLIFSSSSSPIHFSNITGDHVSSSTGTLVSASSFTHDNNINPNHLADHDQWIQAVRSNPGFTNFGFPLIGLGDSWKPNLMWEGY